MSRHKARVLRLDCVANASAAEFDIGIVTYNWTRWRWKLGYKERTRREL